MDTIATRSLLAMAGVLVCALAWADAPEGDEPTITVDAGPSDQAVVMPATALAERGHITGPLPLIGGQVKQLEVTFAKDPTGKWWTFPYPRVERMYVLPGELLQMVEEIAAEDPKARFTISGDYQFYRGKYYIMLREVMQHRDSGPTSRPVPVETTAAPVEPPPPPPRPATTSAPATSPSAAAVAELLLQPAPVRPLIPENVAERAPEPTISVAPVGKPIIEGAGRLVANRLVRLTPSDAKGWFLVAFESDNTLREPPLRVLPSFFLQRMEMLSSKGASTSAVFYVTGEIHRYHGVDYIFVRSIILKRNLDQF